MSWNIGRSIGRAYDEAFMAVAPRRAVIRRHFKKMERDGEYREAYLAFMRLNGYRAAKSEGGRAPWLGGNQSADAHINGDLPAMRNRSRELNRDDSLGSGITKTFVSNWIGTGMRAQARTGDPEKNTRLESVWAERKDVLSPADDLTHGEAQRLIARKILEDGEVIRRAVYLPSEPVWFETIECDRLATPGDLTGNSNITNGVERDASGRPVAYWIIKAGAISATSASFFKVPASLVRHLRVVDRPGQTRGVPLYHAIMQDLRDLDLLMLAALKRTQIAACLSVFVKSAAPLADFMPATAEKYGYVLDQQLEPGMIMKLYPGEDISTLVPNFPTPEFLPFIELLARRIGAALGISYQMVLKDFSKANYSSARTDLLESRQTFGILQSWFIAKYLNWEWQVVMQDAQLRGDPRLDGMTPADIAAVHWIANGWPWIDPLKEAAAAEVALANGTTTLRDICGAQGNDWEEIQDQRLAEEKREIEKRKALGLPPKFNPDQPAPAPPVNGTEKALARMALVNLVESTEATNGNGKH